jgi:hypothetical protein
MRMNTYLERKKGFNEWLSLNGSSGIFREILIERNEDGVREGAVH